MLTQDDLADVQSLALAPMVFQEQLPTVRDVRVNVVGERLSRAAVRAGETLDWRSRLEFVAGVTPVELPPAVTRAVFARRLRVATLTLRIGNRGSAQLLPALRWPESLTARHQARQEMAADRPALSPSVGLKAGRPAGVGAMPSEGYPPRLGRAGNHQIVAEGADLLIFAPVDRWRCSAATRASPDAAMGGHRRRARP